MKCLNDIFFVFLEVSSSGLSHNVVAYDYSTYDDKKFDSSKAPRFNEDPEEFSWWKTKMYSYMGLDYELWMFLKMVLVTWPLMKKELLLIERNILMFRRSCTGNITRLEEFLLLFCLAQSI